MDVTITEPQAALFRQASGMVDLAQDRLNLIASAILAGHGVVDARDVRLVADDGAVRLSYTPNGKDG